MNRRVFLSGAAGVAGFGQTRRELLLPSDTPDELGFRLMWYNPVPALDRAAYRLSIGGLVEKPQSLTVDQLRRLPQEKQNARMKCVQCWSSRAEWGGFRLGHLLESAKPKKNARAIRFDCADKWFEYFSIEQALSPRFMMALDMVGKPLTDSHGGPLRLLDPARYGYKSAKMVTSVTFVEEGKGSMACDLGSFYSAEGEIQPGYDHPLDLGSNVRRRIRGGEITDY
jgi:DMSO/TMAO reductase YedYZ molybdopterin-dependent catalytic subunit